MDNLITHSLSELVRELRGYQKALRGLAVDEQRYEFAPMMEHLNQAANELERLSRLMAQGGGEPAASGLEEKDLREFLAQEILSRGTGIGKQGIRSLDHYSESVALGAMCRLLQAERSEGGSSNPVDDGAVERALKAALGDAYEGYPEPAKEQQRRVLRKALKAALEAAESHL